MGHLLAERSGEHSEPRSRSVSGVAVLRCAQESIKAPFDINPER